VAVTRTYDGAVTVGAGMRLGASGTTTITIADLNVGTSLSDINLNPIPFTAMNGSISTTSIPEPSTLILAATAVLIGLGAVRRRRRT